MAKSTSNAVPRRAEPLRKGDKQDAHRRLVGFEPLETRAVLSALHGLDAVVSTQALDLTIHGTAIQYSPNGLPASISGDLFLSASDTAAQDRIGTYVEALAPILADINGDQIPDFVGTQGVATFNFFVGSSQHVFESITTQEVSLIQGVTAAGQLLVGSQGGIIGSAGVLSHLVGGFASHSLVTLGPSFAMQTAVHFTFNHLADAIVTDTAGGSHGGGTTSSQHGTSSVIILPSQSINLNSGHSDDHLSRFDDNRTSPPNVAGNPGPSISADHVFGEQIDWRLDHLIEHAG